MLAIIANVMGRTNSFKPSGCGHGEYWGQWDRGAVQTPDIVLIS